MRLEFRCRHRYASGFELDVAFAAEEGVTALFGRSGSGKTSVLSAIAGLLRPDAGRIALDGRTLFDSQSGVCLPPHRRGIGLVFQDHSLFPHLRVRGNLLYGLRRRGGPRPAILPERVIAVLELGGLLDRYPRTLSGGERQRVSLGRALLSQPKLLLLDEPWSALDDDLKHRVLAYLERALAEWSLPALLVSHDQASVRRLAGHAIVLDGGRVVAVGTPDEALGQPHALSMHDRSGPVNVLRLDEVERRDGSVRGRVGGLWLSLPAFDAPSGGAVLVQFLPGDVTLARLDVAGISMRNHLPGQVRQIVALAEGVFVAVEVEGQTIWSEITPAAAAELGLAPGCPVVCLVKTHSLRVTA